MLVSLSIQNVVLIERLNIEFGRGFCVLTGETGAGKSILLDALGLALGARSDAGLLRRGAEQASVSATFQIQAGHSAHDFLQEHALESDQTLVLRRVLNQDGRSRAFVNDQPISVSLLRALGDLLVEVHGQFDTQGLLNAATHRDVLDGYAGLDNKTAGLWAQWQEALQTADALQEAVAKAAQEESYLRGALDDLAALDPQPGEEEALAARRELLANRARVTEALAAAHAVLSDDGDPVGRAQALVARASARLPEAGPGIMAALDRARAEIEEALSVIQKQIEALESGGQDLEAMEERLYALRGQARKHHCTVDDLPARRAEIAEQLTRIESGDQDLLKARQAAQAAKDAYMAAAQKTGAQRRKAASALDKLVMRELAPLKLGKAVFQTTVEELPESEWGPGGIDRVRFLVATNPGMPPGPIGKIASGGELARFMLALKVVMAGTGDADTLIFDEVDTGIGGSTADAVGERLGKLGKDSQILVVTHAPQVAARADHHYIIRKESGDSARTTVECLQKPEQRREEIARMLAGAKITAEARAAAERLLETGT